MYKVLKENDNDYLITNSNNGVLAWYPKTIFSKPLSIVRVIVAIILLFVTMVSMASFLPHFQDWIDLFHLKSGVVHVFPIENQLVVLNSALFTIILAIYLFCRWLGIKKLKLLNLDY